MISGGDEAAKHDRIGTFRDQRLEDPDECRQLRVGCGGQPLGFLHECCKQPVFGEAGCGLDVNRIGLIGIVVEHLLFETVRIQREPVAQRARGGGGRGADAPHQCERAPESKPAPPLVRAGAFNDPKTVIEHGIMKGAVGRIEVVRLVLCFMPGEDAIFAPFVRNDVDPAPLHEMARQPGTCGIGIDGIRRESLIKETEQPVEGGLVAAVRRRGKKNEVTLAIMRKPIEESEALLPALVRADAGVRFIHHDERRTGAGEAFAPTIGLDVVEADHGVGIGLEQRLRGWEIALQASGGGSCDGNGIEIEFCFQLPGPLLDEMRRAEHREPIRLAAIDQLAQDEATFYGLADADIVGNEQAHRGEAKRHKKRHQLIGTRLKTQTGRRPERTRAAPQGEAQGLRKKARAFLGRNLVGLGRREPCRPHRRALKRGMNHLHVRFGTRERAQAENVVVR